MTPSPPDEREAIVRWLREKAHEDRQQAAKHSSFAAMAMNSYALAQELAADAIERGEHLDHLPSERGEG